MNKCLISLIPLLLSSVTSCKTNNYSNCILSCMGDSITYGYIPKSGGKQMEKPYPLVLQERLGFGKSNNYGISGSTVSNGPIHKYKPMVDRLDTIDRNSNIVIFWGGGNDWGHSCEIGNPGDKDTTYNLYGALYYVGNYLNNNFPNAFKMLITPLPTKYDDGSYYEVRDAVMYTGSVFSIPVLNMFDESGFESEMYESYSDGIHPTQDFVKNIMVPNIYNFIKNTYLSSF